MQFLPLPKKKKKSAYELLPRATEGLFSHHLQQSFSARVKLKTYFWKRRVFLWWMATSSRNPFQKGGCAWSFIPTECAQALEKCLRNATNTFQYPFGCCLQPCRKKGKKCSSCLYTSSPPKDALFSGVRHRLQVKRTGLLAVRGTEHWAPPPHPRRSAETQTHWPLSPWALDGLHRSSSVYWEKPPFTVKRFRSLSKFLVYFYAKNEFTSSTLSD